MPFRNDSEDFNFFINGKKHHVNLSTLQTETKLIDFIRDEAGLKGTKYMCREGGCGACVVSVKSKDAVTGKETVKAVNSCLTPILSCKGWNIATVEGLGSRKNGLHPIQKRLVHFNGSQCGFCTSGMCMSMHSLLENKQQQLTSADVDKCLDGNICRCTGYRPILDAFKSLSIDASEEIQKRCLDIEDCGNCPCVFNCKEKCEGKSNSNLEFGTGEQWICPSSLATLLTTLQTFQKTQIKYRLVAGNTGAGVYKDDGPYQAFVDIGNISELKEWNIDATGITIGGGLNLSEIIEILKNGSQKSGLGFASKMAEHIERVANVPVRNRATVAGNLMLKHAHKDFPSDIFIILETVATKIRIASTDDTPKMYSLLEFLNLDMYGKVILSICIPQRKEGYHYRSFKISRRFQNAHAYVNAGFLFKIDTIRETGFTVVEKPRILFGGINNIFAHASGTEAYLLDKDLSDKQVLKEALDILEKEVRPEINVLEGAPEYRKLLAKSLLYKTILEIIGEDVQEKYKSGGKSIKRIISSGRPSFETESKGDELHGAATKLEAPIQTTGEAEYINDIPSRPGELFGAFVLSSVANATLKKIDPTEALKMPGIIAFIDAKDIPNPKGNNSMPFGILEVHDAEPIFADKNISYAGQPLGLILADSKEFVFAAARRVKVFYENVQTPILSIKEALKKVEKEGNLEKCFLGTFTNKPNANDQDNNSGEKKWEHEVKGEFKIGGQAHFHMETQCCICVPTESGMDVFSGTQWMDHTQAVVALALDVPTNSINVQVRRLGGAFGAKLTKGSGVAGACAVAAYKTNRPVRIILDMETNMAMIGKRLPYLTRYDVAFDKEGRIGKLNAEVFCDMGYSTNEPTSALVPGYIQNVYRAVNWEIKPGYLVTNTASNTYMRAPGSSQAVAVIEYIMEHIAHYLKKDPFQIRLNNLAKPSDLIFPTDTPFLNESGLVSKLIDDIKDSGDYVNRKNFVENFNATNRWKKRGIALVPAKFNVEFFDCKFPVFVTINHIDGFVCVSHGGVEMGNGVNTKVAQVVAYALGIPLSKISIKPTNNLIGNNASFSGGSITSELCCNGALGACKILMERIQPILESVKEKNKNSTWENVIAACFAGHIDLSATYMHGPHSGVLEYNTYLTNITEVEVDVLTGEYKVVRVDLLEDTGTALNPAVDIGQIEGAYIMGQGLWTTEKLIYDENTGKLLTDRTWTYKVPETKDIPEDFRVRLFSSAPNEKGVLGSKATGEPPLCSSVCILFALKNAIDSARKDAGNTDWYEIESPITPEDILKYSLTSSDHFSF